MTIEGVSQVVNAAVGDMDKGPPGHARVHMGRLQSGVAGPVPRQPRQGPRFGASGHQNMLDLNDAGVITAGEFDAIIDAMTDLDIEAQGHG